MKRVIVKVELPVDVAQRVKALAKARGTTAPIWCREAVLAHLKGCPPTPDKIEAVTGMEPEGGTEVTGAEVFPVDQPPTDQTPNAGWLVTRSSHRPTRHEVYEFTSQLELATLLAQHAGADVVALLPSQFCEPTQYRGLVVLRRSA